MGVLECQTKGLGFIESFRIESNMVKLASSEASNGAVKFGLGMDQLGAECCRSLGRLEGLE